MDQPITASNPFESSLSSLALLAMQDSGAEGFIYFRRNNTGGLLRMFGSGALGAFTGEAALSETEEEARASFPLRNRGIADGVLTFAFPSSRACAGARSRLNKFVAIIEKVWTAQSLPETYREMFESIIAFESELIDSKISTRTAGVLHNDGCEDPLETISRHVELVLRPSPTFQAMTQSLQRLQHQAREREWGDKAKTILQHDLGISEDEAHAYLRKLSRTSRKPFIDVARQVVGEKRKCQTTECFDLPKPTLI